MDEKLEKAQCSNRSRKTKNGERKIPQRGLGVAQLEKLRMEEQQKQQEQQQQQHGMVVIPHNHFQRQMKAFHPTPTSLFAKNPSPVPAAAPAPAPPAPPFSLDLPPRDSIMCLGAAGLGVSIHRNGGSALVESPSCVTHVCVSPDSTLIGAKAPTLEPFQQGLGAEIYGSGGVAHQELRLLEPSVWPPCPPTELPMMSVSSCGGVVQAEPPSNQIYSPNINNWPEEDKIQGRKRLWPFSEENPVQSKSSRPDLVNLDAIGIFRNSVATCFEPVQMTSQRQIKSEMVSPVIKYPSDLKFSSDSGQAHTPKMSCLGQAIARDSCSSTSSMQPGFHLTWKGSCENEISSQENEMPCDFLTLGLPTSMGDHLHRKPKEQSATSDGKYNSAASVACEEYGLSAHLQQERSTEGGSPNMYQFGGLFKHSSSSITDEGCNIPFYKLLCYDSNTKGIAESVYQESTSKPTDLDLRLSL